MEYPTEHKSLIQPLLNTPIQEIRDDVTAENTGIAPSFSGVHGNRPNIIKSLVCLNVLTFLLIAASFATDLVVSQYIYFRQLKHYLPNTTEADATRQPCLNDTGTSNGSEPSFQEKAEGDSAMWNTYLMIASSVPAIVMCLLAGSMSDRFGRKPMFYLGTLSELCRSLLLTSTIYWQLSLDILIIGYVCCGILGTRLLFKIASYSSAADISSAGKVRTLAIALTESSLNLAIFSMYLSTGYLIEANGYILSAIIASSLVVLCLLFEFFFIEETLIEKQPNMRVCEQLSGIVKLFKGSEPKKKRKYLVVCIVAWYFGFQYLACGPKVDALFLINKPFCMSSSKISDIFALFQTSGVLSAAEMKLFHIFLADTTISMLGTLSLLARLLMMAFSSRTWHLYLVAALGLFFNLTYAALRGIMSRLSEKREQGKLFTCVTVISATCTLTSGVVFNVIYKETVNVFRGAVYISFAGCMAIVFLLLAYLKWCGVDRVISVTNTKNEEDQETSSE